MVARDALAIRPAPPYARDEAAWPMEITMSTKPSRVFPEQRPTPPGGSRRRIVAMSAATFAAIVTAIAPAAIPAQQSNTGARPRGEASARVTGMVYDSVTRTVLVDVTVQFVATDDSGL